MDKFPKQAVILAAGESSRCWPLNSVHKSLFKIMGKPLIWYTINALNEAGVAEIIVIQGKKRDIEEELKKYPLAAKKIQYVIQPEPAGIGDALLRAKESLRGQFFVLWAHQIDCRENVKNMIKESAKTGAKTVLVGQITKTAWLYGIARLDGGLVKEIVEKPQAGQEPSDIRIVGTYLLDELLIPYFEKTANDSYDFEKTLSLYMTDNDARIVMIDKDYKAASLKYPWHFFNLNKYLFDKFLTKKNIAKTAQIAKTAVIEGNVIIGNNVKVFEGAVVKGPSYIGPDSVIGNNSIVRDYCNLENKAVVGALCETARVIFQPDVHVHSGYYGDSIFATGCRSGAGTITANVRLDRGEIKVKTKKESEGVKKIVELETGLKALGVIAGEKARIGVGATFMPGVLVGKNCFMGPKSLIKDNLEDGQKIF